MKKFIIMSMKYEFHVMKPRFSIFPNLVPTTNTEHIYVAYTFKVKLNVCTCITEEVKI